VVATNAGFEPFEYTAGDKYLGIDMEIAALLAERLGKELVISNMDFEAVCLSVGQGKADIAMAGLTIKEDRKEYVTFSDKYYDAAQMLIVKSSDKRFDNCKTREDVEAVLSGLDSKTRIGVQNGTTGKFYVEGDEGWGFQGYNVECVGYKSGSLAVQDMLNGNIDLVVIDEAPAKCIAEAINEMN
jgi:polar amino acid transport system substrate-binding protein